MPITIELSQIEEIYHIRDGKKVIVVVFRRNCIGDHEEVSDVFGVDCGDYSGITDDQKEHYKQAVINHRNGRL